LVKLCFVFVAGGDDNGNGIFVVCCLLLPWSVYQEKQPIKVKKGKGIPYSIATHRVLELIQVLGSQSCRLCES